MNSNEEKYLLNQTFVFGLGLFVLIHRMFEFSLDLIRLFVLR